MKPTDIAEVLKALTEAKWAAFFAAAASVLVSLLGAALIAYLREKGKHLATKENFAELLEQAKELKRFQQEGDLKGLSENLAIKLEIIRGEVAASKDVEFATIKKHLSVIAEQAGAAEAGRLSGVQENLQTLLSQVAAVTSKTEDIKQRIGNEIWMQQALRNEKRTIYADLCKIIGGLIHNHEQMMRVAEFIRGDSPEVMDMISDLADQLEHRTAALPEELRPLIDEHLRLTKCLHESRTQLRIYCRPAALRAFEEFIAPQLGTTNRFEINQAIEDLRILEKRIASVASYDLGLPVQGFPRDTNTAEHTDKAEITCPECFKVGPVSKPKRVRSGVPNVHFSLK